MPAKKKKTKRSTRRVAPKRRAPTRARRVTASGLRLGSITPTYTVNDIERSVSWYRDGLGFVVSERWEKDGRLQGVMLKAGKCEFALSQDDFAKGRDRQKGIGCRIYVSTSQDVDAIAERIRAHGGRIIAEPTNTSWGTRSFAVEDPDGFKLSFDKKL